MVTIFSPGLQADNGLLETLEDSYADHYSTFFSTWTDFILVSSIYSNTPALVKGAFSSSISTEAQHLAFTRSDSFSITNQSSGNKIILSFPSNNLSSIPESLFFRILTVKRDDSQGNIEDVLPSNESVRLESGQSRESSSKTINPIKGSAKIESWRVDIF